MVAAQLTHPIISAQQVHIKQAETSTFYRYCTASLDFAALDPRTMSDSK